MVRQLVHSSPVTVHAGRSRLFHRFLGAHSLLIGLLPFFVPVYLWELGLDLADLCLLVGVSGLVFSLALGPWQRMACEAPLSRLVAASFGFELVLVGVVALAGALLARSESEALLVFVAIGVGAANGLYNAYYWTTQRALFAAGAAEHDTGRRYGNLQMIVAVFLKVGILAGGLLIDADAVGWILLLSAVIGFASMRWIANDAGLAPLNKTKPVTLRQALSYRDRLGSVRVFAIDGFFLYLESHFWTLSLFLLVAEDHSRLGFVVIVLAVLFTVLFLLVRSRIDRTAVDVVYRFSVALYAMSWLLRIAVDPGASMSLTLPLLIGVTFCSSLFRMAFNKRFFDLARTGGGHAARAGSPAAYLVMKSQVSQLGIAVVFLPLAFILTLSEASIETSLNVLYAVACLLSFGYLGYRRWNGESSESSRESSAIRPSR